MKNQLTDEGMKGKFSNEDKKVIAEVADEGLQWLEGNADAEADVIEGKKKELEAKFNPIMMRVYQQTGGAPGGMPGGMPDMGGAGAPTAGGAGDAGVDDLD
jgi:L1 cell adhesion molecule like protein